jgi:heme A synthase
MLAGVLIGQIGLGILNVLLLAPVWLQLVHLLIAELFWVLVVLASATLLFATVDCNQMPGWSGTPWQIPRGHCDRILS